MTRSASSAPNFSMKNSRMARRIETVSCMPACPNSAVKITPAAAAKLAFFSPDTAGAAAPRNPTCFGYQVPGTGLWS